MIQKICWQALELNRNPGKPSAVLFRDDSLKLQLAQDYKLIQEKKEYFFIIYFYFGVF